MTINEIITLHDAELYVEYDQQLKIYTLGVYVKGFPYGLFSTTNLNYSLDENTINYIIECIEYFNKCQTPTYDSEGVSISELQEKISDCLYFTPYHSKNTSNTVAIDIYYCDSNNEEHYIMSIPSFSFRLRQFEVYNLVALINYIEHGNN